MKLLMREPLFVQIIRRILIICFISRPLQYTAVWLFSNSLLHSENSYSWCKRSPFLLVQKDFLLLIRNIMGENWIPLIWKNLQFQLLYCDSRWFSLLQNYYLWTKWNIFVLKELFRTFFQGCFYWCKRTFLLADDGFSEFTIQCLLTVIQWQKMITVSKATRCIT